MTAKTTLLQALLMSACLISTGLCKAEENQVAWLRDGQNDNSVHVPELDSLKDALNEIRDVVSIKESSTSAEKRDPKRPKTNNNKNTTNGDDSGVGKVDLSMPLSIGAGLVMMVVFLQY
ncbi:hypothetical protein F4805DRAFT_251139 [Annulohypoxylon moriforme]|nr:hypothetical protein F4805DRAFT_251139 [Annulohypoxylon moriforme]